MSGISLPVDGVPDFSLSVGEVHVWHADLARAGAVAADWFSLLDAEEQARAARLRIPEDRAQFIVAHAIGRRLIGHYLRCPPGNVRFARAANGKPYLARQEPAPDLRISASRTKGYAAYAFALSREVGIDIERASGHAVSDLFARVLAPAEREMVAALTSEAARERAFYALWTCKEAVLKLRGDGLRTAPSTIDTTLTSAGWRVEQIAAVPSCAAAVAAEDADWRISSLQSLDAKPDQVA